MSYNIWLVSYIKIALFSGFRLVSYKPTQKVGGELHKVVSYKPPGIWLVAHAMKKFRLVAHHLISFWLVAHTQLFFFYKRSIIPERIARISYLG